MPNLEDDRTYGSDNRECDLALDLCCQALDRRVGHVDGMEAHKADDVVRRVESAVGIDTEPRAERTAGWSSRYA